MRFRRSLADTGLTSALSESLHAVHFQGKEDRNSKAADVKDNADFLSARLHQKILNAG